MERSFVFNRSSLVIHVHGRGCIGHEKGGAVDADGPRDEGRRLLSDCRVPVVQEVVHAGFGDAGDVGQAPDREGSSGCSLHELAE
jgi:hypothetical protein